MTSQWSSTLLGPSVVSAAFLKARAAVDQVLSSVQVMQ